MSDAPRFRWQSALARLDKAVRNTREVLRPLAHDEPVAYGDGIRVSELSELARMHQETVGR